MGTLAIYYTSIRYNTYPFGLCLSFLCGKIGIAHSTNVRSLGLSTSWRPLTHPISSTLGIPARLIGNLFGRLSMIRQVSLA